MTDITFLGGTPLARLRALMAKLRSPDGGCPWDIEQTFETVAPYTIEEAYEVSDAITRRDMDALREELGDLMFQVVFHSRMAEEIGAFDLSQVCDDLTRKMVRRHPHVFGDDDERGIEEQTIAWEAIKAQERKDKGQDKRVSVLDGVALALPALQRAEKLQKRAARSGFDWPSLEGVLDKITEEAGEVARASSQDQREDEIGDLLFAITNLARRLDVDPEQALRRTNRKFIHRFHHIEDAAVSQGRTVDDMTLDEMESLWQAAKSK